MADKLLGPGAPNKQAESLGKTATFDAITSAVHDPLAGAGEDATPFDGDARRMWDPERRHPPASVHPPHKSAPINPRTGVEVQRGAVRNILGGELPGEEFSESRYASPEDPRLYLVTQRATQGVAQKMAEANRSFLTESADRYRGQPLPDDASPFTINAPANLQTSGRPQMPQNWKIPLTEVADRFVWPDAARVDRLPWIKTLD